MARIRKYEDNQKLPPKLVLNHKLLNCPCCNSKSEAWEHIEVRDGIIERQFTASCCRCCVHTKKTGSKLKLETAWNRRKFYLD